MCFILFLGAQYTGKLTKFRPFKLSTPKPRTSRSNHESHTRSSLVAHSKNDSLIPKPLGTSYTTGRVPRSRPLSAATTKRSRSFKPVSVSGMSPSKSSESLSPDLYPSPSQAHATSYPQCHLSDVDRSKILQRLLCDSDKSPKKPFSSPVRSTSETNESRMLPQGCTSYISPDSPPIEASLSVTGELRIDTHLLGETLTPNDDRCFAVRGSLQLSSPSRSRSSRRLPRQYEPYASVRSGARGLQISPPFHDQHDPRQPSTSILPQTYRATPSRGSNVSRCRPMSQPSKSGGYAANRTDSKMQPKSARACVVTPRSSFSAKSTPSRSSTLPLRGFSRQKLRSLHKKTRGRRGLHGRGPRNVRCCHIFCVGSNL